MSRVLSGGLNKIYKKVNLNFFTDVLLSYLSLSLSLSLSLKNYNNLLLVRDKFRYRIMSIIITIQVDIEQILISGVINQVYLSLKKNYVYVFTCIACHVNLHSSKNNESKVNF